MISILIADDNVHFVEQLSSILTKEEDFRVIGKCYNGLETIMQYTEFKPDVLLLDLDMPGMNGLEIIEYLSAIPGEDEKRNIIIVSGEHLFQSNARKLSKVKDMVHKMWDNHFIIDSIREIKETDDFKNSVIHNINILFDNLNFDSSLKGTTMLIDAVFIAFYNGKYLDDLDGLLIELSQKHKNIKRKTIRSDMDKAITAMYNYNSRDSKFFCKYFPEYFGFKPTTKHFIKCAVKYLRNIVYDQKCA